MPSPGRLRTGRASSIWFACRVAATRTFKKRSAFSGDRKHGMTGIERIAEAFESARASGRRAALMPYLMGGFPDIDTSRRIGLAYARSGADLVELGVPFSDPLADGLVIHAAGTAALAAGATLPGVLEVGQAIAAEVPVVLMCYDNLAMVRGLERFVALLVAHSVSGLIVPDLPLEEAV